MSEKFPPLNSAGKLLSRIDRNNNQTTLSYDANGNPLTETDATGTVTYTYNQFGEALTRTDQLNNVTTNTYDAQGNLLTLKDALNHTTTFTYDTHGQLLTVTDARGKVTTFIYDTNGNQTEQKDANNISTLFFYDARSRLTEARDALNHSTLYEYDAAGRIKKLTHPDNSFAQFTYDLAGRRTKVKDERSNETNYAYDSANRLTGITDALNQTATYAYDSMSNLTSVTDALGRVTNYDYDDFNRPVKITYPPTSTGATRLFATLGYDAAGNRTQRTDTAGRVTSYAYDSVNRVTSMTDADNKTTAFEYDARSRVTGVLDALTQHYQFAYDALGRRTQITRGGHSMSMAYDAVGNRTQRTDYNGATTNYAFDNLNRLTTIAYPDSTTATYVYDQLSRLTSATNESGTVTFAYDNRNRVSGTTDVWGKTISYGYDANNNRTSLSMDARNLTYSYDVLNRLTQIAEGTENVHYSYNAVNQPVTRTLPNGVAATYQYDGLDRLTRLTDAKNATTVADHQYQYNTASQITQITEPAQTRNFTYDSLDRLTAVTNPTQTLESYSYDGVGNRTASQQSSTYSYQPFNQLTSTDNATYTYDLNGNLTSQTASSNELSEDGGQWQYTWDAENRLVQVGQPPSSFNLNYQYDALGRRVGRASSTQETQYSYDGEDVVFESTRDPRFQFGQPVTTEYLNGLGIDEKLRTKASNGGALYFTEDQLSSTRALTDTNGNVVESIDYDSFGNGASSLTRYGYTGREFDADTGLYYYRNRWYDPQVGRFISEDPIGLSGGINPYVYVENDPTSFVDPDGTRPLTKEDLERLNKLQALLHDAQKAGRKELADATYNAIVEIQAAIAAVPEGQRDPANLSAALWAIGQLGNDNYSHNACHCNGQTATFPIGSDKCNIFVAEAYAIGAGLGWGGSGVPTHSTTFGRVYPNVANTLATVGANVPNFPTTETLGIGTIVSFANPSGGSGHTGISVGGSLIIHAARSGVKANSLGELNSILTQQYEGPPSSTTWRIYQRP